MNTSDERRLWDVVVLVPLSCRVWASNEESARKAVLRSDLIVRGGAALVGTSCGFPESMTVTEVVTEEI